LFAPDREQIANLESWLSHAPPEHGRAAWQDGESAKEQAKAWLRPGAPAVPEELWSALAGLVDGGVDEVFARPEHPTILDGTARPRQHDMFACARRERETVLVVGVEAKGRDDFDGLVADRAASGVSADERARCNLLSRALFGRDVVDEGTGDVLDEGLGRHGHGLWTAAVGTIIEAQERGVDNVALVVHQFVPRDLGDGAHGGDTDAWASAIKANAEAFEAFAAALEAAGATSFETEYVKAGTRLRVVRVESPIDLSEPSVSA
jgi:hypothetical protein